MLSHNIRRAAAAVLCLALVTGGDAALGQSARRVINAETITYYPPFESKDLTTNKLVGFDVELIEALASKIGADVQWIESSFSQVSSFASIKTGRADVSVAAITDVPERHAIVSLLDYIYFNRIFFTLKSGAGKFPNMEALCGKRVGASRGSVTEMAAVNTWSDKNCVANGRSAVELVPGETTPQVRLMLQQDRIDAAISGVAPLAYWNTLDNNQYTRIGKPIDKALTAVAFSKENEKLGEELKGALAALMSDGAYGRLLAKYGLSDEDAIERPMINGRP